MSRLVASAAAGVLFAVAGGWSVAAGAEDGFTHSRLTIVSGERRFAFAIEVADSDRLQRQGLQGRRALAADAGMLFDFAWPRPVAMWMKDTYLPLDMLFIGADGIVVRIAANTQPQSLTPIPSGGAVRAVLEINAGTVRQLGIRVGDRVLHPIFGDAGG